MIIEIPEDCKNKIDHIKIELMLKSLALFNYDQSKCAKFIGASRRSVSSWIRRYPVLKEKIIEYKEQELKKKKERAGAWEVTF